MPEGATVTKPFYRILESSLTFDTECDDLAEKSGSGSSVRGLPVAFIEDYVPRVQSFVYHTMGDRAGDPTSACSIALPNGTSKRLASKDSIGVGSHWVH